MDALMLIDLQVGLCKPDGVGAGPLSTAVGEMSTLDRAAECLDAARSSGVPVMHVRLAFDPEYRRRTNRTDRFAGHEEAGRFLLGSADTEFCPEVAPREGELVTEKGSVSPFASTGLLGWLRATNVRDLAIAGVATHLAVESAARESADRGFLPHVVSDACAAPEPVHSHALSATLPAFAQIVTTAELVDALSANPRRRGA